jgi:PAS domain-containing protein
MKKNKKRAHDPRGATRAGEERFQALMRLSSDFYWETDQAHRLTELVYGAGHRIALPRERLPDAAGWHAHIATLEARLPFHDFEFAREQANGELRHYSVSGEPVFDAAGEFRGYRGIGRDISERKRV